MQDDEVDVGGPSLSGVPVEPREARRDFVAAGEDRLDPVAPLSIGQEPSPQTEPGGISEVRGLVDVIAAGVICLPNVKQRAWQGRSAVWPVDGSGQEEDLPLLAGIGELGTARRAGPVERTQDVGRCGQALLRDGSGGNRQEPPRNRRRGPEQEPSP